VFGTIQTNSSHVASVAQPRRVNARRPASISPDPPVCFAVPQPCRIFGRGRLTGDGVSAIRRRQKLEISTLKKIALNPQSAGIHICNGPME
jgi:hypothetical protein